jgi:methanogenic corrinoid protein MtbC1
MRETVKAVKETGSDVKVLIGGPIIDDKVVAYCGADFGSNLASDGVKVANKVFGF